LQKFLYSLDKSRSKNCKKWAPFRFI